MSLYKIAAYSLEKEAGISDSARRFANKVDKAVHAGSRKEKVLGELDSQIAAKKQELKKINTARHHYSLEQDKFKKYWADKPNNGPYQQVKSENYKKVVNDLTNKSDAVHRRYVDLIKRKQRIETL